jgi:myo-inositol-1(or 4)-monophosphatase
MISEQDQRHYLAVARRAVAEAAELVRTHAPGKLTEKGDRDPASEVDLAVERSVRDFLHNKTPEIEFLAKKKAATRLATGFFGCLIPLTAQ